MSAQTQNAFRKTSQKTLTVVIVPSVEANVTTTKRVVDLNVPMILYIAVCGKKVNAFHLILHLVALHVSKR